MWPDRVSNPGPLTYEPGALPNALRGPATSCSKTASQLLLKLNLKEFLQEQRLHSEKETLAIL